MCGRFTLTEQDPRQLALELGVDPDAFVDYRPRYNIAPTDPHWIVRVKYEDRELLPAKWGLINSWAKDAKRAASQINARAETLECKPAFKALLDEVDETAFYSEEEMCQPERMRDALPDSFLR